ncbi:MAG: exonuclease domain-containing protein [Micromonosporaceae bacterium]
MPGPIVGSVMTSGAGSQTAGDADVPDADGEIVQGALDGLALRLAETDFVVVDLETTGGSPADAAITEIGAVRVPASAKGGAVQGGGHGAAGAEAEFAALVNPGQAIPSHVAALTGITDAIVATAPRIEEVLPRFIEFAAGSVLVAHNAPFDIGFLTAACARHDLRWPAPPILDTAALARRVLTTDEVNDCRLGTLAMFFGAMTAPNHRALDDARATAAVLRGLIERLERRGIHTLEELRGFAGPSPAHRRRMRQLTASVPRSPGVCLFTGADGRVLHVMKSSDMHGRACGYFSGHTRPPIREMAGRTARIVAVSCATALEAEVAQIRLIAEHRPPYQDGCEWERSPSGQLDALAAARGVVAARPRFSGGGWDIAWIRGGLLEGTAVLPPGARPRAEGEMAHVPVRATCDAEVARKAEAACLLNWLLSPGVRLIDVEGTWCSPVLEQTVPRRAPPG